MKWWLFPTLGGLAGVAYFLVPPGLMSESIFVGIGTLSILAVVIGIRINRPVSAAPWILIAIGSGLWVIGDLAFLILTDVEAQLPMASIDDVVYLLGYPVLAAGLFLLVHREWGRGELGYIANSAIVMIAFGLLMWVFVVDADSVDVSTTAGIVSVAYPAMDVYLLGLLVHFIGATEWESTSFRLMTAAVALALAADTAANVTAIGVTGSDPNILDIGYLSFYLLVGTAALHPSMRALTPRIPKSRSSTAAASFGMPTVMVLAVAALTPPAVMVVLLARGDPVSGWGWPLVLSATLLVCLVFTRVVELLRLLHRQTRSLRATAHTDFLTGLLNRRGLEDWIDDSDSPLAILLLDIDRFQDINDTFGHTIGDAVLQSVADRLRRALKVRGVVGRLGADEFAVGLCGGESEAHAVARTMHDSLRRPITVRGATLLVEASIGIATGRREDGAEALIQHSNLAMQSAKTVQPRIATYTTSMDRDSSRQLLLLSDLTSAIEQDRLEVYYQPQVDLRSMTVVGVEALLRWNHPVSGLLEPDLFLPMAERTGLIRPLLDVVLRKALVQRQIWCSEGIDLVVSVNISTRNLLDSGIVEQVAWALADAAASPQNLIVEITETAAMTDPPGAVDALLGLRALGIALAIDDYGTGYSSLAYLQQLPVQQLKIDKAFVLDMATIPAHHVIVRSTIDLASALGLTITAEGVENHETLLELKRMGCHYAQGYDLGRPMPADEIPAAVAKVHAELGEFRTVDEHR
ncbi:bifunctional diguanylate cyclase/phosphodiesterase [Rhodococcus sp. G-MC3]|uniref:putative bifunctional diguanylate cyclase/phosphodiesterase n=1 Tax=Rhodococcus sp. G-MC3 TaxID=3046209 RepID=UPI0024B894CE|nr:bifunctional diguanylate cyclase/phosphodiesterase [Rhodococcus sp. G-MC3]MDJ0393379.1 bifunctional diguanylate cyclase/phosphodiesterase [Rhodococcus sp. G-MC3]